MTHAFRLLTLVLLLLGLTAMVTMADAQPATCPYDIRLSLDYCKLSEAQQTLFDSVYDAIRRGDTMIPYAKGQSQDYTMRVIGCVQWACPELCAFDDYKAESTGVRILYRFSIREQDAFIAQVQQQTQKLKGKSNREGLQAVNKLVISQLKYDYAHYAQCNEQCDNREAHEAYYAWKTGKTVCSGYADLFAIQAHFAGYPAAVVTGEAGGGRHVWNVVLIDNCFTFVDSTWNDTGRKNKWFAVPIERMNLSHTLGYGLDLYRQKDFLPDGITLTQQMEIRGNGSRLVGTANHKSYSTKSLKGNEFYSPALHLTATKHYSTPMRVSYQIDGVEYQTIRKVVGTSVSDVTFRPDEAHVPTTKGKHTIVWFFNSYPMEAFTWTVK